MHPLSESGHGTNTGRHRITNSREAQIQKDMEIRIAKIIGIAKSYTEAKVGEVGRRTNVVPLSLG